MVQSSIGDFHKRYSNKFSPHNKMVETNDSERHNLKTDQNISFTKPKAIMMSKETKLFKKDDKMSLLGIYLKIF